MKCKCGGDTTATKVIIKRRGKDYRVVQYQCKECQQKFYVSRIYIPVKGQPLRRN